MLSCLFYEFFFPQLFTWIEYPILSIINLVFGRNGVLKMTTVLMIIQLFFTMVIGLYFFNMLKSQQGSKTSLEKDSKAELEKLHRMRSISLSVPLSEKTRPANLAEIIGQEDGIRALRAALCGPNPQHILIYGPPGVGKTAAARVILQEAINNPMSPFRQGAKFIEMDATTMRFDERGIADPLIGSVHDPIYQGAGAYGPAGVPQPKAGAVTKAHGGVLFIDEIGELHSIQMNKLLKVLEDRKVFLESAYYSTSNKEIPAHIHEIFQKGLPADFRLIGATTRQPEDIPPAIRSRCVEIFFRAIDRDEICIIAKNAAGKGGFVIDNKAVELVGKYAQNGRDAVQIVQIAGSVALLEDRRIIYAKDVEWVVEFGHYSPRHDKQVASDAAVGLINGLAVFGANQGMVMDIEASAVPCVAGTGQLLVTGIVEQEEMDGHGHRLMKTSSARASIDNMMTVLNRFYGIDTHDYNIHINFPGGIPIDGPSAGTAIVTCVYSAITGTPIPGDIAMTGELSIHGKIKPIGGVVAKVAAAMAAGVKTVYVPRDNYQDIFEEMAIEVIPTEHICELFQAVYGLENETPAHSNFVPDGAPALISAHAKGQQQPPVSAK